MGVYASREYSNTRQKVHYTTSPPQTSLNYENCWLKGVIHSSAHVQAI